MKKFMFLMTAMMMLSASVFAVELQDSNSKVIGYFSKLKCGVGLSCALVGAKATATVAGIGLQSGAFTTYATFPQSTLTSGTSTQGVATTLFMAQVVLEFNSTLTGIAVTNGATVGTNKYIVALFNSAGVPVATSALAGVTTAGASGYQKVPFTAAYTAAGPAVYWIGVYINGTTDNFMTMPAVAAYQGLAGTITSQTFGTVVAVTPPTTFTAGAGPVAFTY